MDRDEIRADRLASLRKTEYECRYYKGFNYSNLRNVYSVRRRSGDQWVNYSDAIIMADTETSKSSFNKMKDGKIEPVINYVVAWTVSIRAYGYNIVTLYGHTPSELMHCFKLIRENLRADHVFIYFHNLAYDWTFLQKFIIRSFEVPEGLLATKPHYPISIKMKNGIEFRDSLILSQKSLDKWAKDMKVDHQKATGKWNYDKHRTQKDVFTSDELEYIEHDTLAGVECIDALCRSLGTELCHIPLTATGIVRKDVRDIGKSLKAHDLFKKCTGDYSMQMILESVYHGGYTHANRHFLDTTITSELLGSEVKCYDFASSYPFIMMCFKVPMSAFYPIGRQTPSYIIERSENTAFITKVTLVRPRLKDRQFPMPALQLSKCIHCLNPITDNGRLLGCDYCEIWLTEIDLDLIIKTYEYDKIICDQVYYAQKGYLPKWFRDYIFKLFTSKTMLKGIDEKSVDYAISKAKINSNYGMCVQKPVKPDIVLNYDDYTYEETECDAASMLEKFKKYKNSRNSVLPFSWGVWVTAYAMHNLFDLGACAGDWLYSDTDSVYGCNWNMEAVASYNNSCKNRLKEAGYGPVVKNDREYWLGIAEHDGDKDTYTEYRYEGAKRYCGRCKADGELHLTVAGVPKKTGAKELNNDIANFTPGMIFRGTVTGKKMHTYINVEKIYTDKEGNEIGDSIDLTPCDYILGGVVELLDWDKFLNEEILDLPTYGQEDLYD